MNEQPDKPLVSVVIPTYKRPELVRKAVLSALNQDLPKHQYEVIVVDSSPDDRVVTVLRELQTLAGGALRHYVKPTEGPGPSRNLGVERARADIIAFLDSDCQATPGWLRAGMAQFEEGVGLVQGKTVGDPAGPRGVFTRYVTVERENFVYECCNIFYRREAFEQAGGFPGHRNPRSDHPLGGEDLELAWKVKRNGWQSRFAVGALVHHEILPISVLHWIVNEQHYVWPLLARRFPELRQFFFARYFLDRDQACFFVALLGVLLAVFTPVALVFCLPYAALRGSVPSRTFRGILRPLRILAYLPRDAASFALLLAGSLRHGALLL